MEDLLIMHFIAKTHTNGRGRLTGVVTTTGNWTYLHFAVLNFVRANVIYKRYRFTLEKSSVSRYAAYNFIELFASSGHVGPGA